MTKFLNSHPLLSLAVVVWLISTVVGLVLVGIGVDQPRNVITYWGITLVTIPPMSILFGCGFVYFVENA